MLIATGVLIAFVLAVMVGNTAHVLQGLGWLPSHADRVHPPVWANRWLGLFATSRASRSSSAALLAVVGSYVVARELQSPRPPRAPPRRGAPVGI